MEESLEREGVWRGLLFWAVSFLVFVAAVLGGHAVQTDFGNVSVSDVFFENESGQRLRAKLFRPRAATGARPLPGVVFVHGYQNNRESGDAYNIELARRGMVVLGLDALGRGNSDVPLDLDDPRFDPTFGTRASVRFLRSLPFVRSQSVGAMGHSMGARFAYEVALDDPGLRAVVIVGSAYDERATPSRPKNMLMVIGELDEFRDFFTGTRDIHDEWMKTRATRNAFAVPNPAFNLPYGRFSDGTARMVFLHRITHIQESHNRTCIAAALGWMRQALEPPDALWIDAEEQIWPYKEAMTLLAMVACFVSVLPLAGLLIRTGFFRPLARSRPFVYACPADRYITYAGINGLLMWLYLPLIMTIFAIHKFVVPVDRVFPMLLVDGIVWWFVWINIIGLLIFRVWYRKEAARSGVTLYDLGISHAPLRFGLDKGRMGKTALLALILFGYLYAFELLAERLFMMDFRFIYPLVSDLTAYRAGMFLLYLPFLLFGFLVLSAFVHGQLRPRERRTELGTYVSWTASAVFALVTPLALFLLVQYVPLLTVGFIPFEGPGGVFVVFILELFFIMLTLTLVMILSTRFYQLTGTIYLGAFMSALIVTWLFASSQVIAPIP